jgi:hypothetical protein
MLGDGGGDNLGSLNHEALAQVLLSWQADNSAAKKPLSQESREGREGREGAGREERGACGARGREGREGRGLRGLESAYIEAKAVQKRQKNLEKLIVTSYSMCPSPYIDLSHCTLARLPHSLCRAWKNVRTLRLGNCWLYSLPSALRHLGVLEELSVEANRISYLPCVLWSLTRLHTLNASDNCLEWLSPGVTGARSLRKIDVSRNCLLTLPAELATKVPCHITWHGNTREGQRLGGGWGFTGAEGEYLLNLSRSLRCFNAASGGRGGGGGGGMREGTEGKEMPGGGSAEKE